MVRRAVIINCVSCDPHNVNCSLRPGYQRFRRKYAAREKDEDEKTAEQLTSWEHVMRCRKTLAMKFINLAKQACWRQERGEQELPGGGLQVGWGNFCTNHAYDVGGTFTLVLPRV